MDKQPVSIVTYGLDLSLSSTGFCKLDNGSNVDLKTIYTKALSKGDFPNDLERMKFISNEILTRISTGVSLICVEDYFVPQNKLQFGSAIKLIGLGTLVRMALYESGLPFIIVSPSQIKKFGTGKGNCDKNMVLREVYKKWQVDAKDDNQADAYVLARIAESIMKKNLGISTLLKYEQDVVSACIQERPRYNCDMILK